MGHRFMIQETFPDTDELTCLLSLKQKTDQIPPTAIEKINVFSLPENSLVVLKTITSSFILTLK